MADKKYMDVLWLSIVVTALQVVLSQYVYPILFGSSVRTVYSVVNLQTQTAIGSSTAGDYIFKILSGYFNVGSVSGLSLMSVTIGMFIGTYILLTLGYWVAEQSWAWKGKDKYQRLWAILLYGTIALGALLYVLGAITMPAVSTMLIAGLAINYAMIGAGAYILAKAGLPITI